MQVGMSKLKEKERTGTLDARDVLVKLPPAPAA